MTTYEPIPKLTVVALRCCCLSNNTQRVSNPQSREAVVAVARCYSEKGLDRDSLYITLPSTNNM